MTAKPCDKDDNHRCKSESEIVWKRFGSSNVLTGSFWVLGMKKNNKGSINKFN